MASKFPHTIMELRNQAKYFLGTPEKGWERPRSESPCICVFWGVGGCLGGARERSLFHSADANVADEKPQGVTSTSKSFPRPMPMGP